jgi:SAM-dependent methyltransferase
VKASDGASEMNNFWKDHYNHNTEVFKDSLRKQVGKTVNGVEIDDQQLHFITTSIIDVLCLGHADVVIDLCCGNGLITKNIAASVKKIIGVDFSKGLIDTAKSESHAENITYMESDVLHLSCEFFRQGSKYYMYEALQLFSKEMLGILLKNMSCINNSAAFFIGSIPDKDKLLDYYNTEEKRQFYHKREMENRPHMGKWWDKTELELLAVQHGFKAHFYDQTPLLYTSYYRFDCLLENS